MAAGVTIRVVSNRLPTISGKIRTLLEAEVAKATLGIEAAAKAKVPVRTATLQRSIHSVISGLTGRVGPSVYYGIFVEMGTRRMGARPYMRPAAEAAGPKFVQGVTAALKGL